MSKKNKKGKSSVFKIPTTEELYENQVKEIVVKPTWYDVRADVFYFFEKLFAGYLWECKHGTAFIAMHQEASEVERMLQQMESLRARDDDKNLKYRWAPNQDEEEALLLIDIARMIPKMWD